MFGKTPINPDLDLGSIPALMATSFQLAVIKTIEDAQKTYLQPDTLVRVNIGKVFFTEPNIIDKGKFAVLIMLHRHDHGTSIINCELTIFSDRTFFYQKTVSSEKTSLGFKSMEGDDFSRAFIQMIEILNTEA